jgi:hypothetical protein
MGTGSSWDQGAPGKTIQYTCYAYVTGGLAAPCPPARSTPGTLAWHPHTTVRLSAGLSASVDLADGHVAVAADHLLSILARGPALAEGHV